MLKTRKNAYRDAHRACDTQKIHPIIIHAYQRTHIGVSRYASVRVHRM